jgi:hypothetical protein
MRRRLMQAMLALVVALILATPSLAQGRGRGLGKTRDRRVVVSASLFDRRESRRVIILDDGARFSRGRFSGRPRGWDRGRKVGWGRCDVPPGLAKKVGCGNRIVVLSEPRPRRTVIWLPVPVR